MAQRFYYHALITLPSSVNSYSKRLFITLPQVFIAVNGEVCLHNAMIQGEMFLLIRSVVDAVFLVHCWTPQLNVCFYSAAPAWQASKGVEERKERKKSGKFQFPGGGVPTSACTGRSRPKGVSFSGFRYMRNLSFGSAKVPQRANRWILWLYKFEETVYFRDWFLFERQCI